MRSFGQDLVVAWRALWRAKPFATAAILTLGLGIAGVAVLLAFIQGVLLRPLPIRDQDRVIVAWKQLPSFSDSRLPFVGDAIKAAGEASRLLEAVGGVSMHAVQQWPLDRCGHLRLRQRRARHRQLLRRAGHPPGDRPRLVGRGR